MMPDVGQKLLLCAVWPRQEPLVHSFERSRNLGEIGGVERLMSCSDRTRLVVDLSKRPVRLEPGFLDILGIEAKDMRFRRIHPDDRFGVQHGSLLGNE